jgi:hypothetical protein
MAFGNVPTFGTEYIATGGIANVFWFKLGNNLKLSDQGQF